VISGATLQQKIVEVNKNISSFPISRCKYLFYEAFLLGKSVKRKSFPENRHYQAKLSNEAKKVKMIRIVGWIKRSVSTIDNIFIVQILKFLYITMRAESFSNKAEEVKGGYLTATFIRDEYDITSS
jgi:hypothetical protein